MSEADYLHLIESALAPVPCPLPTAKVEELKEKAREISARNYRLRWYNSVDGQLQRLVVGGHLCALRKRKCCPICDGNKKGHNRPKTRSMCTVCNIHLCRDPNYGNFSCWDVAHMQRILHPKNRERKVGVYAVFGTQ